MEGKGPPNTVQNGPVFTEIFLFRGWLKGHQLGRSGKARSIQVAFPCWVLVWSNGIEMRADPRALALGYRRFL